MNATGKSLCLSHRKEHLQFPHSRDIYNLPSTSCYCSEGHTVILILHSYLSTARTAQVVPGGGQKKSLSRHTHSDSKHRIL